ncbi:UTP--glucose-1-phosphate uridylyltransferase [Geodia barretti]|uniref:UTP--glucose-1-phosphate uridylyltransferase n=1 Tax=Geodia barretti TaxID=519541 RepID=A0AA35WXM0_GEOBA|nr:UTP--glucose-1-phosphate uridylyltransferase [Geodia barretti]
MSIRKAVIPAAGFGTRFLPVTRTIPKVMIPVLNEPAIQFSVREAADAGIEHIVFVISRGQEATNDYFKPVPALEDALEQRGNTELLNAMRDISSMIETSFVYQDEQLGLGHAVLMAKDEIGDEPFAVFLPDDIIWADSPPIGDMIKVFSEQKSSVIAVKQVPDEAIPNLGVIDPEPLNDNVYRIKGMVEKPRLEDAPSNLAIVGRYVLTPEVFDALEQAPPGAIGEIQLTDAIEAVRAEQGAYAYKIVADHFDVGTPLGMLKASVYAALKRDDMARELKAWLKPMLNS